MLKLEQKLQLHQAQHIQKLVMAILAHSALVVKVGAERFARPERIERIKVARIAARRQCVLSQTQ